MGISLCHNVTAVCCMTKRVVKAGLQRLTRTAKPPTPSPSKNTWKYGIYFVNWPLSNCLLCVAWKCHTWISAWAHFWCGTKTILEVLPFVTGYWCIWDEIPFLLLFQGVDMSQNLKGGVIMTNGSLVLQGLNRNASGKYNCVATNSEGPAFSNTVQLDIKCKSCKTDHCNYEKIDATNNVIQMLLINSVINICRNFMYLLTNSVENVQFLQTSPSALRIRSLCTGLHTAR